MAVPLNAWSADLNADGTFYIVTRWSDKSTTIATDADPLNLLWIAQSPIDGWDCNLNDSMFAADLDSDGRQELLVVNPDRWTGVMKWPAGSPPSLRTIWAHPNPLDGPGGQWVRNANDVISVCVNGPSDQVVIFNNNRPHLWLGVLQWDPVQGLAPIWMAHNQIDGPAGIWHLESDDVFTVPMRGQIKAVNYEGYPAVFVQQNGNFVTAIMG